MKRLLLSIVCMCMIFSGCSSSEETTKNAPARVVEKDCGMELIAEEIDYKGIYLYRNVYTDVLYLLFEGVDASGLEEMHDPETGLPLTFQKYQEMQKKNMNTDSIQK